MTTIELRYKIEKAKSFLNNEIIRIKTDSEPNTLSYREIGNHLDRIHEVERIGVRNLDQDETRNLTRLIAQLESIWGSSN